VAALQQAATDEVILMHAGKLVAQGSVAELQRQSAEFRQLLAAYERSASVG
jgi:ABC-type transport system involved in cytochrome bd biosynthesis fused ATPase/permease subunit